MRGDRGQRTSLTDLYDELSAFLPDRIVPVVHQRQRPSAGETPGVRGRSQGWGDETVILENREEARLVMAEDQEKARLICNGGQLIRSKFSDGGGSRENKICYDGASKRSKIHKLKRQIREGSCCPSPPAAA